MLPVLVAGGVAVLGSALWSYGYTQYWKPHITSDAAPTDNLKQRVCKLHFDIYKEENWHKSLYDFLGAKFTDTTEDIIVACQGKLVHLRGSNDGSAMEPENRQPSDHDNHAKDTAEAADEQPSRISFDDVPVDMSVRNLNSAVLIFLNEGERKRYDREVFGPALFSDSYMGEKVLVKATKEDDMDEWKIGNEKNRRLQKTWTRDSVGSARDISETHATIGIEA